MIKKSVVVTGGLGFIGSNLIRLLLKQNYFVINIDKVSYSSNFYNTAEYKKNINYKFYRCDINNQRKINQIFNKHRPICVFNLAAETHVDRSINAANNFIKTNIFGTYNMLEVSREYYKKLNTKNKKNFKFHHISTDEVYGDLNKKSPPADEDFKYSPSSPYSASKASSDHLVRSWFRTYNLPVIISNCSNNYGPNQFPEKLIPLIILNALEKKKLPIYGNGHQIRDWLYVNDHAEALFKIIIKGKVGETYNIGGNNEIKNIDVVKTICKKLDTIKPLSKNKSYVNLIEYVEDRPGHDNRYAIDTKKIKKILKWKPKESFETGIEKTINWYLEKYKSINDNAKKKYDRKRLGLIK